MNRESLSSSVRRSNRRGVSYLGVLWLVVVGGVGSWLLLTSTAAPGPKAASGNPLVQQASFSDSGSGRGVYRPIEKIRVGQRVITPGTGAGKSLPTEVNPATWRKVKLVAYERWPDDSLRDIRVTTLVPYEWLESHGAVVGGRVPVPLDLKEMGLPQTDAEVVEIEPCPAVEDGPGRVVLTTVDHPNRYLFDLKVQGERGPPQEIRATGWHKVYSEERGWTSIKDVLSEEVLEGRNGPLSVVSIKRHPGTERVYNITVEAEHQYFASTYAVRVHNADCMPGEVRTIVPSEEKIIYREPVLGKRSLEKVTPFNQELSDLGGKQIHAVLAEDGTYHIMGGNHRVFVAASVPGTPVELRVLTPEEWDLTHGANSDYLLFDPSKGTANPRIIEGLSPHKR